ncbi:MAG: YbaB/EbfC family nucleoid-associated protein [Negativicutes bacterium]|nr:YbaB/EbfC family nucleoid-associated protein [Negativicutes bacterium]
MLENFGNIMEMVKSLQQSVNHVQERLQNERIEVASGDAVKVIVNGQQSIVTIEINSKYLTPDNASLLQGLLTATVNNALAKSREIQQAAMDKLAGDLNLPKIPGLF